MKNIYKQLGVFFGSQYNIYTDVSNLSDNLENFVKSNTIFFIDYAEKIPNININYALNRLLELIDNFKRENYNIPNQLLDYYEEYFDILDKNHQVIEKLFKDSGFDNSLNVLRQAKTMKQEYKNKIKKHIDIAKKYSLEEIEKIIVEISKSFIVKAGIPIMLVYLADIKQLKSAQSIARFILAKHPYTRIVLPILSGSIFVYEAYTKMRDKDKRIKFKNDISIYFGHILYIIDMINTSFQTSYFINIINEQYGAFRIENKSSTATDNFIASKIVIDAVTSPITFDSNEHLIEFSVSNKKIMDVKYIQNNDRSFAQLSLFTGLIGAIYDPLEIQQNTIEYLSIKFYNFVKFNQKNNRRYSYISYNSSIVPKPFIRNDKIGVSSSFEHIKNLFLKSHNFILVKTQSFSSIIIYDLLFQSLKTSNQKNKPINKHILIITTPSYTESFEYQMQKHIKKLCANNENIQSYITFMTPICRINKEQYFISLRASMLKYSRNIDEIVGDTYDNEILAFLTRQRQAKIKKLFNRVLKNDNGYLKFNNIDCNEFIKFCIELQTTVKEMEFNVWFDRNDTNFLVEKAKIKNPNEKEAVKKAFDSLDSNFKFLVLCVNQLCMLTSYFYNISIANIDDFKKDIENKKKDIEKILENSKNNLPNNLVIFSQIAIKEYLSLQNYIKDSEKLENQISNIYKSKINNNEETYKDLFLSIDSINTHIIENIVGKITPIPNYIFTKILTEETYIKFCFIVFIDFIINNKDDLFVRVVLISEAIKSMENKVKKSDINTKEIFTKNLLNNTKKTIGDKAIANFFNKPQLTNSAIYLIFGINKPKEMIESTIKNLLEIVDNTPSCKISIDDFKSFGINFLIDFTIDSVFNIFFIHLQRDSLREEIAMLLLSQKRYKSMPYTKWEKDNPYMYVPDTIKQTFASADFTAMLIGGSPFNSGCCIHNPSIAGFVQDKALTHKYTISVLKNYVCGKNMTIFPLSVFYTQTDSIFKEAYCKVLHYIGLAKDEHTMYLTKRIPNATKEKIKKLFNPQTLMDTESLIKTKVKIDSNVSNDDKNFIASKTMTYSRDFLIQLKRIAEYNYLVYSGSFDDGENYGATKKKEAKLLGSLIYDKDFIPTTIDVKD